MTKNKAKKMVDKMEWIAFRWDFNLDQICWFNIFECGYFYNSIIKLLTKEELSYEEFSKEVKSELLFQYWSKCEYEVVVRDLILNHNEKKIDVYDQVNPNLDKLVDYIIKVSGYKLKDE